MLYTWYVILKKNGKSITGEQMKNPFRKISARLTLITVFFILITITGSIITNSLYSGKDNKETVNNPIITVYVSIPPMAYFVERIGGSHVAVETLIEAGNDPHTYEPTPKKLMILSDTDLFFSSGMPFETQLLNKLKASNPRLVLIETDKGIVNKDHNNMSDPHIWLSPPLIKIQSEHIFGGLVKLDPGNKDSYENNYRTFISDLDIVHEKILELLDPYRGRSFMVFHPAFGHFADAYGLIQRAIEIEGKEPSPKQLENVIIQAMDLGIKTIFVEPQFDRKNAQVVADSINADIVSLDPLKKDVLENLEAIAKAIEKSF
jgi:zinc transport system substrate-binding protein